MRAGTLPHSALTIPRELIAERTGRRSAITYLRALTLTVWFGTLVMSYWWRQDWNDFMQMVQAGVNVRDYYFWGLMVALAGHLTLGFQKWMSAPFKVASTASGAMLSAFCLLMLLLSPLSHAFQTSGYYAIGTWVVIILCSLYWASDFQVVRQVLVFTGIALFGWLLVLLVHHGMPQGLGQNIGGINRNTTSTCAIAAMICCSFSPKRSIRIGGFLGALFFATLVTSRGSLVALCVFFAVYYMLHKGTVKAAAHGMAAVVVLVSILLASAFLQETVLEGILHTHDQARGIGSGFTGRVELWKHGIEVFWQEPIIGRGFRSLRTAGVGGIHSGYIQILVEAGLVGGLLIVAAVCVETLRRMQLAQRFRALSPSETPGIDPVETAHVNAIVCATMCVTLMLWVYEPLYINLGSVISVMFFLMWMAPSYISAPAGAPPRQGAPGTVRGGWLPSAQTG